jgi:Kyakuja-Dileera-Zisupton transposase
MGMLLSKACDITGIVAVACARHGCFAPNSVANLFRGEQQKNVDWSLLQALKTTNVDDRQGVMIIYDIACQYIIHLQDRIGHLLPAGLTIDAAIGLFHVHGHKDSCFFRFATSFIPGAGVVAGEILESLWAVLNAVTPAMRTATLAHRAEIMDDHMTDSNHKKSLGMSKLLSEIFLKLTLIS